MDIVQEMFKKISIEEITNDVENYKPEFDDLQIEDNYFANHNFIMTENAKKRLKKIYTYIKNGVPLILEGDTGCAKTFSAELICEYIQSKYNRNEKYIKFSMNSEVKISDLLIKIVGNENSLTGISINEGPFLKAAKLGIPLILDEINLSNPEVLQCIEGCLDSGIISVDSGIFGLINERINEGFCLIATQNPGTGKYINKRQALSDKFLSHFQIITFDPFSIKELENIANGLYKKFAKDKNKVGDNNSQKFIKDLVSFHDDWNNREEIKESAFFFTIREIAASVKAYIDGEDPFDIMLSIYASRYSDEKRKEVINELLKRESFKNGRVIKDLPENFPECFENNSLKFVVLSALFSLRNERNIIIAGESGT